MNTQDELFSFADDDAISSTSSQNHSNWRILIADDDDDVHDSTVFALRSLNILNRPLEFLHAYSAAESVELLRQNTNVAVILLDVVMETEDAGLRIVKTIRQELGLAEVRIILRTGQPGYAPEMEAIGQYEINDYKTKNELTRIKLYTSLTTAIRSYDQLQRLNASRAGLRQILDASHAFITAEGLCDFAAGVIMQIAGFIGIQPEGLVCARALGQKDDPGPYEIIGAAGRYAHLINQPLALLEDAGIQDLIKRCLHERDTLIDDHAIVLFCPGRSGNDFAAFIDSYHPLGNKDRNLIDLFCANIGLCGDNISLISRLRDAATVDSLVKLPNRLAFIDIIDQQLEDDANNDHVVALLNIDGFAEFNDVLDSRYGDLLLREISNNLRQQLPASVLVARVGGAGFGLLGADEYVNPQVLHNLFRTPLVIDGIESLVSFSMGMVRTRDFPSNGSELFQCASVAQKRAKAEGQIGKSAYYTLETRNEIRDSSRLLHDLRLAMQGDQSPFFLVYQPQIDLASDRVVGLEALIRWKNQDGTIVPPDRFIPIAEQSGLIVPLGNWILRTALADLQRMRTAGFKSICMAVNVSAVQFRHPDFLSSIDDSLFDSGIAGEHLELEITESVGILSMEIMQNILSELKTRRISIAIDDFGTGFSSLSYLDRFQADRLKIDRSFITLIGTDQPGVRITEMVVPLGQQLGMKVLAEGVENVEQLERLRQLGCDEIQGYYTGRPMVLEALLQWLIERPGFRGVDA
ncbi:EAL domain-containing protein [Methylomonas montana]|uniref:GGDEF/EAL domain-containing response regulator n=1 Tax=Methylomonas montana TaxID=3058963 RepID=UPI00265A2AAE|nr:EAL domain-containing protein [Methylomonas montana]WKJ88617.1 EAL domain-containing protein [Methylomonas montana]